MMGRVITAGNDAARDVGELGLVPVDALRQVRRHPHGAVVEVDDASVLAGGQSQLPGAVGILEIHRPVDVLDDGLDCGQ
jgi:hypothetical protein